MKYEIPILQAMAGQCRAAAADSQAQTGALSTRINADVTTGWEAGSAQAFLTLYQQWQAAAQNVQQALLGIGSLLDQTATTVTETDAAIARGFSQAM
ncbi:MAG: WXG100 family type VII secretion target [Geodermatophilaceae bacterium]|jgi:WXG100 family type VII secretion target|nr:WXG100 family type VII secretion target [Geodermatophilaceae bacterium]MDQ3465011.1 WXG100 family type VII secretion target [Actinomycetota bacterium]